MRRFLILLATLAMTIGLAVPAIAAVPADFSGVWVGVDGDGSNQIAYVTARRSGARMTLFDLGATVCGGAPLTPILAHGSGSVEGGADTLKITFNRARCFNGHPLTLPLYLDFTLQSNGTIQDGGGNTWYHVG